ncbi:hypothetical protein [Streptosporangium brasiliense]|uniref:Trehalose/maltose hydrolase-like predicted phosphorylase n=1 Tax=Streptosporangium brasiliense TaxID=47480 RepID=A0ABT9RJ01_9ACTN|nr:hypothetical protein [Streptosporangium brasiliense]MDP9868295.1 trehalose/maltose hydrolase-like predicted phosphorylase [Streptosporangium brasiliense]
MEQRRLVSMDDPHLAALTMTVVAENWSGPLEIRSVLDGRVTNAGVARYRGLADRHLVPICGHAAHGVIELLARTATSRVEIALAARTTLAGGPCRTGVEEGWVSDERTVEVKAGEAVTVEKVVALYTSRDRAITESEAAARAAVVRAGGFSSLLKRHARAWDRLWQRAHVTAEDVEAQQILNLCLFHLLQTASPHLAELDEKYTDIRRLDRILEAEGDTPNRYKVSKQADVLMLLHLLGQEGVGEILTGLGYEWNAEMAARTVDYYLARTCHGSTLSAVVHAGVLARLRPGASHPFLVEALNNDGKDLQGGTTAEGIHLGAMAGVVCLFEAQARP